MYVHYSCAQMTIQRSPASSFSREAFWKIWTVVPRNLQRIAMFVLSISPNGQNVAKFPSHRELALFLPPSNPTVRTAQTIPHLTVAHPNSSSQALPQRSTKARASLSFARSPSGAAQPPTAPTTTPRTRASSHRSASCLLRWCRATAPSGGVICPSCSTSR